MTRKNVPLETIMLLRRISKSKEFDPLRFFQENATLVPIEYLEEETTNQELFTNTLGLADRMKRQNCNVIFWEGFAVTKQRIAKRHFWIKADKKHFSLSRRDSPYMEVWGIPIPDLALTICTLSAAITTSNGCLGVICSLPKHEQIELAWLIHSPHNKEAPVSF